MSRHTILNDGQYLLVVGWDDPLGTFFAQLYHQGPPDSAILDESDDEDLIRWAGYDFREIQTLEQLAAKLAEWGYQLSETTARDLAVEANLPWEPGPLQKALGFLGRQGPPAEE